MISFNMRFYKSRFVIGMRVCWGKGRPALIKVLISKVDKRTIIVINYECKWLEGVRDSGVSRGTG